MNPSTALALVLIDELIAGGVTEAVLAPGSRNAPLSMALANADSAGRIRLHVRIDERTAGFLAVGLARGSGHAVAVVTTSGTAVANLHPAVLEAHHGAVPIVVLTADRPPSLRNVGANQVIDQTDVFGSALRFFHEFGEPQRKKGQNSSWRSMVARTLAYACGAAGRPGPVQLNIPLAEPLLPDSEIDWPESLVGRGHPWTHVECPVIGPMIDAPADGERVLFVGDLTQPGQMDGQVFISEAGGAAGFGVISTGLHLLKETGFLAAARPDRVVVLGRPTMYRQVAALLADPAIVVDVVASPDGFSDSAGSVRHVAPRLAPIDGGGDPGFVSLWRRAEARSRPAVAKVLADLDIGCSPRLAADLVAALPGRATLVLGSSQSPRDVGLTSAPRDGLRIVANRGVAGIDGTVSTAVGIALAALDDAGPTVALMGDLTFLHDITGLLIGPHEPRPDLVIVVSNNDGGGIFHTLEPGDPLHARSFERVFGTPQAVQIGGLAEAAGAEHVLVSTADELADAIADPSGIRVVELPTGRTDLRAHYRRLAEAVHEAIES